MAAALLAPGRTTLHNVPRISDIAIMAKVLRRLDCEVEAEGDDGVRITDSSRARHGDRLRPRDGVRASICVLGPLLARRAGARRPPRRGRDRLSRAGHARRRASPGRLRDLGRARLHHRHRAGRAAGRDDLVGLPQCGGDREPALWLAVLAKGITEIDNAAREPEIVDICAMLTGMGAHIQGAGTSKLVVEGVSELRPVSHRTIGDRIVAGTWAFGAAITSGYVHVTGIDPGFLEIALDKVDGAGAHRRR